MRKIKRPKLVMQMIEAINGRPPWSQNPPDRIQSPYQDLATAIVLTAVEDYKKTMRKLWKPHLALKEKRKHILSKNELEGFFHSEWYEMLTDISPDRLIYHSIQTAKEEERRMIEKQNQKAVKKQKEMKNSQKTTDNRLENRLENRVENSMGGNRK